VQTPNGPDPESVVDHLVERATWSASRSSGPGGQRRDKVSTQAELSLDESALDGLPEPIAERLRIALGLDAGPLRITAQEERLLSRNREICRERLLARVLAALAPPPPPRRRTKPRPAARAERLQEKRRKGAVKELRRPPADAD
jgi:ribosome-associated protein